MAQFLMTDYNEFTLHAQITSFIDHNLFATWLAAKSSEASRH
jgi:hypothetical protein